MAKKSTPANGGNTVSYLPTSAGSNSTPPRYRPVANITIKRQGPKLAERTPSPIRRYQQTSRYVSAHTAEPCAVGSLVHSLASCGHKIITVEPEDCASNCIGRPDSKSEPSNHRNPRKPFICWICVREIINEDFQMQRAAYERLLHKLKDQTLLSDTRYENWRTSESIWAESVNEIETFVAASGRQCKSISGEPFSDIQSQNAALDPSIDCISMPSEPTLPLQVGLKTRISRLPRMKAASCSKPQERTKAGARGKV